MITGRPTIKLNITFVLALGLLIGQASVFKASAQVIHVAAKLKLTAHANPGRNASPPKSLLHRVKSKARQSIAPAVLVNDEPITNYEISKRQALLGARAKGVGKRASAKFKQLLQSKSTRAHLEKIFKKIIADNKGKSREEIIKIIKRKKKQYALTLQKRAVASARASVMPGLRKKAMEELIKERLQIQEAKRLNVLVSDEELDGIIKNIAKNNKMTPTQFADHLKKMGTSVDTMRSRFRAMLSWRNVVRSKYGYQISVKSGDIDRFVSKTNHDIAVNTQFKLQRITLALPANAQNNVIAQRLNDANAIRNSFSGCGNTGTLVKKFGGARLENIGDKNAATIKEPTRSLILNAADGEMLPPQVRAGSVHLWIVCGRKAVSGDAAKRTKAKASLKSKEFEVLGRRHLKDLRQDANIEYKD